MTNLKTITTNFDFLLNSKAPREKFQDLLEDIQCVNVEKKDCSDWVGKALTAGRFDVAFVLSKEGFEIPEQVTLVDADISVTQRRSTRNLLRSLDYHFKEEFDSENNNNSVYSLNLFLWTGIWFQLPNGEIEETATWVSSKEHQDLLNDFYYDLNYSWDNQDGIDFWEYFFNRQEDYQVLLTRMSKKNYDGAMSCFPKALVNFMETNNKVLQTHSVSTSEQLKEACVYLGNSSPPVFDEIQKRTGDFVEQYFKSLFQENVASLVNGLILNPCNKENLMKLESLLKMSPITYALIMDDPELLQTAIQYGHGKDYVAPESYLNAFSFKKFQSANVNFIEFLYWHIYVGASNERLREDELVNFCNVCAYAVNNRSLWQPEALEKTNILQFLKDLDFKGQDDWIDENMQVKFHDFFDKLKLQEELKFNVKKNNNHVKSLPSFSDHRF